MSDMDRVYILVDDSLTIPTFVGTSCNLGTLADILERSVGEGAYLQYLTKCVDQGNVLWGISSDGEFTSVNDKIPFKDFSKLKLLRNFDLSESDPAIPLHTGVLTNDSSGMSFKYTWGRECANLCYVWDVNGVSYYLNEFKENGDSVTLITARSKHRHDVNEQSLRTLFEEIQQFNTMQERKNFLLWKELLIKTNTNKKENVK